MEKCPGSQSVSVRLSAHIDKSLVSKAGGEQCMSTAREPDGTQQAGCIGKANHFKAQRKPLQKHTRQANSSCVKLDINSLEGTNNKWGQVQEDHYPVKDRKRGPDVVSCSAWAGP